MRGFHNLVLAVATSSKTRSAEITRRVSDPFLCRLIPGITGDPQDQLGDCQLFRVQLDYLVENKSFHVLGLGRSR